MLSVWKLASFVVLIQAIGLTGHAKAQSNPEPPVGESSIPTVLEATEATTITFNVQTREAENSTKMSNVSTISHVVGISDSISTTESQSNNSQTTISEDNFVNLGRKSGLVRNNFTSKESPEITTNNPTTNDGEAPSTTETTSGLSVAVSDRAENVSRVAFGPNVVESTSPANITSQTRRINSKYHELSTLNSKNLSHSSLFLNCTKTKLKVVQEKSALKDSSPKISIQNQIILVASILGGVLLLMILCVLVLSLAVMRLKDQIQRQAQASDSKASQNKNPISGSRGLDNIAFSNSPEMAEKRPDSRLEMERLGYEIYNGKRYSENGHIPRVGQSERRDTHHLRMQDGVIPVGLAGISGDHREFRRSNPIKDHSLY